MKKKVLVIIPSYKPDIRLRLLLSALDSRQSYPISGIHIINTEKKYWQEELLPKMEIPVTVTHIPIQEFDHGGTRHLGAVEALADFLLFMTQDAVPADDRLVKELVTALEDRDDAAVAYARQLPVTREVLCDYSRGLDVPARDIIVDEIECYTRQFNYPSESKVKTSADIEAMGIKAFFCSNVCAMYRKAAYESVGGFVRPTIFNEDMIFAADALNKGFSVVYQADALVYHSHRYGLGQLFRRNFDIGVSQKEYEDRFCGISSEKEGARFILATAKHLCKHGCFYLIPRLIFNSAVKYAGYFLGKRYEVLPDKFILRCTSGKDYWINRKKGRK